MEKAWTEKIPIGINLSPVDLMRVIAQMSREAQFLLVRTIMEDWSDDLCSRIIEWLMED